MYIRRTQTRSNATGKQYFTYRLVRSERIAGKVKQVTLLNLGRHFAVDQSLWPVLCVRIDQLLAGQASLVDINLPKSAAVEAERIAAQLQMNKAATVPAATPRAQSETEPVAKSEPEAVPATDVQAVDVNTLELVRPRSVGVEHIGLWAMRQVAFVELLRELDLSSPIRAAILGVIIGRMAAPGSELAAHRWLGQQSGLGELLDVDFERMLNGLDAPADALVVMAAGIATEANLIWLREHSYRYLVVSRERAKQFEAETAIPIETAAGATVHIQRVDDPVNQEVRLYCHSDQREQKEQGINQRLCERFEAELKNIAGGLSKPRAVKRIDKVHERIGRLKEKCKGIGQHYTIDLLPDVSGEKVAELRWTKQPQSGTRLTHPGVYCLRSNQTGWDSERLWRTYIMLTDLEAVFRSFKPVLSAAEGSELGLRPVYHHKEIRVDGHLFITVLAYQFVQIIRKQLQEYGIQGRWSSLRMILSVQQRVTASFRRADGGALHIRKATRPETELAAIYQALNLDPLPGGVQKTYV